MRLELNLCLATTFICQWMLYNYIYMYIDMIIRYHQSPPVYIQNSQTGGAGCVSFQLGNH